jgi:hypothetical protein
VELTFWDFGVRNPTTSKAKTSTTTIPEIAKRKERGTKILGFQGLEFCDFKNQNINHKQFPKLQKIKECRTNISGFRGSEFHDFKSQNINHKQFLKL